MKRAERARTVVERLSKRYGPSLVERIGAGDPYRVLVATILSQRTRDEVTGRVSEAVFARWPTLASLAEADEREILRTIREVGFGPGKARHLAAAARKILTEHDGRVPATEKDLLELPGVGQKTAGCVLVYAFGEPAIPVDAHVHRISNLLRLVETRTPERTREELERLLPRRLWAPVNRVMVLFGREICLPRRPRCGRCPLADVCPSASQASAPK